MDEGFSLSEKMDSADVFRGMDLNVADDKGYTAAHKACLIGDWDTLEKLMDHGASLKTEDRRGRSALWFAHLHLKAARAMAARLFFRDRIDFYVIPEDLEDMTDAKAKQLGRQIWQETSPPGPMRVS